MAEELVLTDPVVEPEKVTSKLRVTRLFLDNGPPVTPAELGVVEITVLDNFDKVYSYRYTGQQAIDYIKFINTGNFTTTSLQKRILQRLTNEGVLPPGTVVGTPDPPAMSEDT